VLGWIAVVLLWAARVVRAPGSVVFLLGVVAAVVFVAREMVFDGRQDDESRWQTARRALVVAVLLLTLLVFDIRTSDVFNVTKFAVVVVGALALAVFLAVEWIVRDRLPRLASRRPVLAIAAVVAAALLTTVTSTNPRTSFVGAYGSYDGLVMTVCGAFIAIVVMVTFTRRHVLAFTRSLFFGGGGLVAFYGLLQMHDQLFTGATRWDWLSWGDASFKATSIWSTLGNPNHLGGFLAILLPIGLAVVLTARSPRSRWAAAVLLVVMLVELVQTTTRGAWLATAVSAIVLAALLARDLRANRRVALAVGGALAGFVLLALVVVIATPTLQARFQGLMQLGGRGTLTVRVELGRAALRMAADKPVTGFGPDTFRVAFQDHQTPHFVKLFGPRQLANGGHNLLLNQLATQGIIGLAALVSLLVVVFRSGWRASRDAPSTNERLVLAACTSAVVAYVVQATFNVQQVGLTTLFWALAGLLVMAAARDPESGGPSRIANRGVRVAIAAPVAVVCVALALAVARPYRADVHLLEAQRLSKQGAYLAARAEAERAMHLYGWEPRYAAAAADASARAATTRPGNPKPLLVRARISYERALAIEPRSAPNLRSYGEVLLALGDREGARRALDRAITVNPYDSSLRDARRALA
jgi:O-antigen ligase